MSEWLIYGRKNTDKKFHALDPQGRPVRYLAQAMSYATKDDAQEIINKAGRDDCTFEVRRAPKDRTMSKRQLMNDIK